MLYWCLRSRCLDRFTCCFVLGWVWLGFVVWFRAACLSVALWVYGVVGFGFVIRVALCLRVALVGLFGLIYCYFCLR